MSSCDACIRPGACCSGFVVSDTRGAITFWDTDTRQQMRDAMAGRGLPFLPIAALSTHTDAESGRTYSKWSMGCPRLGGDGRCTDYENRPQLCRDFEVGSDTLCVMHVPQPGTEIPE